MSDLEKNSTLLFNHSQQKSTAVKKTYDAALFSLEKITEAYERFPNAYQKNNLYALFNISADFYTNTVNFITLSHYLFANRLINPIGQRAKTLIDNMDLLISILENIQDEKQEWLSKSKLLEEPSFAQSNEQGNKRFEVLEHKIKDFFELVSSAEQEEKSKKMKI